MSAIPPIGVSNVPQNIGQMGQSQPAAKSNNLFQQLLTHTNNEQMAVDNAIRDFVQQKEGANVQQVVMALAEAEMSFQFFMEVRNQLIDSYSELMRMQF